MTTFTSRNGARAQAQAKQQCRLLQETRIFMQPSSKQGHSRLSHGSSQEKPRKRAQLAQLDMGAHMGAVYQWPDVARLYVR